MADKKPLFSIFSAAAKKRAKEEKDSEESATQTQATPASADADFSKKRQRKSSAGDASRTPASTPRMQGSSFVVCPVCFGSVPRALVDVHVPGCLVLQRKAQEETKAAGAGGGGGGEQMQQQRPHPRAAAAAATAETSTGAPASDQQQQQQQQPLRPLSQVLRPQRVDWALAAVAPVSAPRGGSGGGGGKKTTPSLAPPPLSQQAPPQPPAAAAAAAAGASAFAEMMRAQRSAATTHVFYLEIRGDSFFWHWGEVKGTGSGGSGGGKTAAAASSSAPTPPPPPSAAALPPGLPPAAWTAELSIPLPSSSSSCSSSRRQKVAVRLATNLHAGPQQFKRYEPRQKPTFPSSSAAAAAGGNAPASSSAPPPPPPPPSQQQPVFPRLAPSLLKSALQKNVRLGRAAPAVRVAAHLLRQGETGELLRRLPVIVLEDACLTPALPLAVWMMAAFSKGWDPLPSAAERAILKFVHSLACSRVRDDPDLFDEEEEEDAEEEREKKGAGATKTPDVASLFASPCSDSDLDPQAALLVRVLHLRAAFGGMPCDVSMMKSAAETWLRRFAGRAGMPPPPAPTTTTTTITVSTAVATAAAPSPPEEAWLSFLWRSFSPPLVTPLVLPVGAAPASAAAAFVGPMTREDIPLSAVDFHVSSISEELLNLPAVAREAQKAARAVGESENDSEAAEERLRRAMWLFRSSRNVRSVGGGGGSGRGGVPSTSTSPAAVVLNGDTPRARALRARSVAERDDLRPLWRAAAAAADSWSSDFLRQRFGARRRF